MEFECNSLASCSYSTFELIADQSIYFAAKNMMDQDARNGPALPLGIALISKIGSLSLYYGKKLQDHYIHPIPSMSYSGVKGIFGAYIVEYLHKYSSIGSRAGMAVSMGIANILSVVEHYLFESEHESTESNFICDDSWKKENEILSPNATGDAYASYSSAFNVLAVDVPNAALKWGSLLFFTKSISKRKFSQIFAGSVLSLLVHASVLKFGDQDSTFIRSCKILNGEPHLPVAAAMFLKFPLGPAIKSPDVQMYIPFMGMMTVPFMFANILALNAPGEIPAPFFVGLLNLLRLFLKPNSLQCPCIKDWGFTNATSP